MSNRDFKKQAAEKVNNNVKECALRQWLRWEFDTRRVGTIFSERFNHLKLINELKKISKA